MHIKPNLEDKSSHRNYCVGNPQSKVNQRADAKDLFDFRNRLRITLYTSIDYDISGLRLKTSLLRFWSKGEIVRRFMSSSSVITPEDVLESLMNDGTIDSLRLKIINQLKANEELKNTTIKMVEQSKVLNTPGAEKQTKRELFDALRQELEAPVLEKASKSVWELILDNDGLGKEINDTVEKVFCRLSGKEFPPQNGDMPSVKETENNKGKGKEPEDDYHKEKSYPIRKRSFNDMNGKEENNVADGAGENLPLPEEHSRSP